MVESDNRLTRKHSYHLNRRDSYRRDPIENEEIPETIYNKIYSETETNESNNPSEHLIESSQAENINKDLRKSTRLRKQHRTHMINTLKIFFNDGEIRRE